MAVIVRRGPDQLRLEYDPATGEVELRAWSRLIESDPFGRSPECLRVHADELPPIIDALRSIARRHAQTPAAARDAA